MSKKLEFEPIDYGTCDILSWSLLRLSYENQTVFYRFLYKIKHSMEELSWLSG